MATPFTIAHDFPVSRDLVLKHHTDEALHERANAALGSASRSLDSAEEQADGTFIQRFKVDASKEIPGAAAKVLKPEMLIWIEESVWDPKTERFRWKVLPTAMKDKISCAGELWYEDQGDTTRRVVQGEITIKIPFVGKVAEQAILANLQKTYDATAKAESKYYSEQA